MRRWLCLLAVALAPMASEAASVLSEDWVKVQRTLAASDQEAFADRIRQLRERAVESQALKLTPYAEGLVLWASRHPDALGGMAVRSARELDPELPSSYFLVSRWQWHRSDLVGAARSYVAGWWAMFLFEPSRTMLGASAVPWILLSVGCALLLAVLVQTLHLVPRIAHDALELSRMAFRSANAAALAGALMVLPLFAGLGPIWLLMYLFILGWAYMGTSQRVAAAVSCGVLALLFPSLAAWQQAMMRWPTLETRIASMVEERRIDFPSLRELTAAAGELEDDARYHLLLGELYRMHGDGDEARMEFQKAALAGDDDATPWIFLGNMALEDGDVQLAIQLYTDAIQTDSRNALGHRNLSSAYDQSRRFQDGDTARTAAKEIAGEGWQDLGIPGRDPRVRYPQLRRIDVEVVTAALAGTRGDLGGAVAERFAAALFSPMSAVFWVLGIAGILVQAARDRWMWTSQRCGKCGKTFCPRCKTSTESESLCSQCISVFLKRDVVAADLQAAKQGRVRRWAVWSAAVRRVAAVVVPSSHDLLAGRPWLGIAMGALAWTCLFGAVAWLPRVLPSVEPFAAALPVQVLFAAGFVLVWVRGILGAWQED